MAKMLMGQINHARERIKTLTTEKLGPRPDIPDLPEENAFKKGLDDGTISISPAFLEEAIGNWACAMPRTKVEQGGGRWQYQTRDYAPKYTKITSTCGGNLADYLAYTWFQEEHEALVAQFETENAEYNRRKDLITREASRVEDAIVLGDNAAALAALENFAAFTV